jgi:hypothetical protein
MSEWSASRPGRSLPPGKTRDPLYRRLDGLQGRYGQVRKISLPPGFDPRTVQPVSSRYTNYVTLVNQYLYDFLLVEVYLVKVNTIGRCLRTGCTFAASKSNNLTVSQCFPCVPRQLASSLAEGRTTIASAATVTTTAGISI